jgi:hypothetical protein
MYKTPQEAVKNFIKSQSINENLNIIVNIYVPEEDKYQSKGYNSSNEYIKTTEM